MEGRLRAAKAFGLEGGSAGQGEVCVGESVAVSTDQRVQELGRVR